MSAIERSNSVSNAGLRSLSPSTQLLNDITISAAKANAKPRPPLAAGTRDTSKEGDTDKEDDSEPAPPAPGRKRIRPTPDQPHLSSAKMSKNHGVEVYVLSSEDEARPPKKLKKTKQKGAAAPAPAGEKANGTARTVGEKKGKAPLRPRAGKKQSSVAQAEDVEVDTGGAGGAGKSKSAIAAKPTQKSTVVPSDVAAEEPAPSDPPKPPPKRGRGRPPAKANGRKKGREKDTPNAETAPAAEKQVDEDAGDGIHIVLQSPAVDPKTPIKQSGISVVIYSDKSKATDEAGRRESDMDEVLNRLLGASGGDGEEAAPRDSLTPSRPKKVTEAPPAGEEAGDEAGREEVASRPPKTPKKSKPLSQPPPPTKNAKRRGKGKAVADPQPPLPPPEITTEDELEEQETTLVGEEEPEHGEEVEVVGGLEDGEGGEGLENHSEGEACNVPPLPQKAPRMSRRSFGKAYTAAKAFQEQHLSEGGDGLLGESPGPLERLKELEKHLEAERKLIDEYITRASGLNKLSRVGKENYLTQISNIIQSLHADTANDDAAAMEYLDKTLMVMRKVRTADEKLVEKMLVRQAARSAGQTACIEAIELAFKEKKYISTETAKELREAEAQARKLVGEKDNFDKGMRRREIQKISQMDTEIFLAAVRVKEGAMMEKFGLQKAARQSSVQTPSRRRATTASRRTADYNVQVANRRTTAPSPLIPSRRTTAHSPITPSRRATATSLQETVRRTSNYQEPGGHNNSSNLQVPSRQATKSTSRVSATSTTAEAWADEGDDHYDAPVPAPAGEERPWSHEEIGAIIDGVPKHRGKDRWLQIMLDNPQVLRYRSAEDCRQRAIEIGSVFRKKGVKLGSAWQFS